MPSRPPVKNSPTLDYLLAVLTTMPDCTAGRWPFFAQKGYGSVRLDGTQVHTHVLVCTWYHGPRPPGMWVRHLCGKGHLGCFSPKCLRWGTPQENAADTIEHRRQREGD